jgi:hypothetical protein
MIAHWGQIRGCKHAFCEQTSWLGEAVLSCASDRPIARHTFVERLPLRVSATKLPVIPLNFTMPRSPIMVSEVTVRAGHAMHRTVPHPRVV